MVAKARLSDLNARERCFYADKEALQKSGLSADRYPESEKEIEIAEKILCAELEKLSLIDHEQALFDIHGLPQYHNEDPPNIDKYLQELEKELRMIEDKEAYDYAKYLNEDYVNDPSFRLMFLRSDLFDPRLAAQRMVYHFELKKELFGDGDILVRDVCLSDLNPSDIAALESGFLQVLRQRDAAGRPIFFTTPMLCPPDVSISSCVSYLHNVRSGDLS